MSKGQDYIPTRDADFNTWLDNLAKYVNNKCAGDAPAWTHIPPEALAALNEHKTAWDTAYADAVAEPTPAKKHEKTWVRGEMEQFVRGFVNQYLRFPPVTNEDRDNIGVPNHDTKPTPHGAPTTVPVLNGLEQELGHRVLIRFHDENVVDSQAIPYGYNGCLLNYAVDAEKVTDTEALEKSALMTRSPWRLDLAPEDEGKWLSVSIRWQSGTGKLGARSEVQHIVVG
jgi:hypothetical protein